MRWKLMRRRLSVSAPRMIVRSHLPWPLRWAVVALMLGFSAAIAVWAFEFGKDIAGLDKGAKEELIQLRIEVAQLKAERERTLSVANTADSLLKAEKASQERLAQQLKQIEAENLAMKADLGFFERLLPAGANSGLNIRGFHAEAKAPGQIRFTLLVMQPGKTQAEFRGNYELTLQGTLDGKPWSFTPPNGSKPLQLKQYLRVEGMVDHPPAAVVKSLQIRVLDSSGGLRATQTAKL
jgi:hypothetical protein